MQFNNRTPKRQMTESNHPETGSAVCATRWLYLIIFAATVVLHGIIILKVLPPNLFIKYQVAAQQSIEGSLATERLMDFSPIYLRVHILAKKILSKPDTGILWLQISLTALSAVLLFELMRSFYLVSISLAGTLLFVTHQSVIIYTGTFEPEPFAICFALGFLVTALKQGKRWALLSGIFLSLSLLTRQNFFLLILLTPVYFRLHYNNRKDWVPLVISFLIPILLTVAFLSFRNSVVTGSWAPYANHPGNVFFEGNNPNSLGQSAIYPPLVHDSRADFPFDSDIRHVLYRLFLRRISEKPVAVADVNTYWSKKALNFMVDYPLHTFRRLASKITYIFHQFPRHDIPYLYTKADKLVEALPTFPFALISALALIGMILSAKAWKEYFLICMLLFSQLGIMLMTYVSERQRVAVISLMIFLAAGAFQKLLFDGRNRIWIAVLLIFLTPFLYIKNDTIHDELHVVNAAETHTRLKQEAAGHRDKGNLPLAARANAMAYAYAPWYTDDTRLAGLRFPPGETMAGVALETALLFKDPSPSRLFDIATLFVENGRLSDAEAILKYLIDGGYRFNRRFMQSSEPYFHLARIHQSLGNRLAAVTSLKMALTDNPGDPWALSYMSALTGQDVYRDKLIRYFGELDAAFFLGKACYEIGRYDDAINHFSYVVRYLPEYRKTRIYLSLSLGGAGKYRQAAETYVDAIRGKPDAVFREEEVLAIFRNWSSLEPRNEKAKLYLGMVMETFGHYSQAYDILHP